MPSTQLNTLQSNIFDFVNPMSCGTSPVQYIGPFTVFSDLHAVFVNQKRIPFRPREYELFIFMIKRPMRILSRNFLLQYVWDFNTMCNTNTVDVHIGSVRRKLEKFDLSYLIETVYGLGYICVL